MGSCLSHVVLVIDGEICLEIKISSLYLWVSESIKDVQETMSPPDAPSCIAVLRDQTKSDEIAPKPSIRAKPSNLELC
jgi:hypothetical protein